MNPLAKVRQSDVSVHWGKGTRTRVWDVECPFLRCGWTESYMFWQNAVFRAHNHMKDHFR